MFGETVLGYIRTDKKAAPRWVKGIWLGKALTNDTHILAHSNGVFCDSKCEEVTYAFGTGIPGEFGYAALGHRMMYNKTVSPPQPFGMPMIDVEAVHVQNYAAMHPNEDMDPPADSQVGQQRLNLRLMRRLMTTAKLVQLKLNESMICKIQSLLVTQRNQKLEKNSQ